jgi:hypothetical protein
METSTYSGLVQARERCVYAGILRGQGDMFEVKGIVLYDDDPYEAVVVLEWRYESVAGGSKLIARCARIYPPVSAASARMAPEHQLHAGLRRPTRIVNGLATD